MISYYLAGAFLLCIVYFKVFDIRKGWKNALILAGVFLIFYFASQSILGSGTPSVAERIEQEKSKMIFNLSQQQIKNLLNINFEKRGGMISKLGVELVQEGENGQVYRSQAPSRGLGYDKILNYYNGGLYLIFKNQGDYNKFHAKLEMEYLSEKDTTGVCKKIFKLKNDCFLCSQGFNVEHAGYIVLFHNKHPFK